MFLQGDLERGPDKVGDKDYKSLTRQIGFRNSLINQGFNVDTLSLENGEEIPSDIAVLVIADPKVPFDTATVTKIKTYIAGGGNLFVLGEPGKQALLDPILQPLGVHIKEGMIVQQSKDYAPDLVFPFITADGAGLSRSIRRAFEDSLPESMPAVAALSYDTAKPLESGRSWRPILRSAGSRDGRLIRKDRRRPWG